ncbi:MAG TPA: DUF4179 domain-containing protein [Clostridiaceae bacterium]
MDCERKSEFEQIKVSDKLDAVIKMTIEKARHDANKIRIKRNISNIIGTIAASFVIFILSINISPAFAESVQGLPIVSSLSNALLFHYDKNIANAEKQNVKITQVDKGINITIDNIVSDDKDLFILYTLDGQLSKDNVKNLLLENFTLKDENNNILLDSKDYKSPILSEEVEGKAGDYIMLSNKQYKCIVSSLGNSLDSFSKDKKTFGSIELISVSDSSKIPNEINIDISSLTEAYNTKLPNQNSSNFTSKFNREPFSIEGKWNFNVKIDKSLKSKKPEEFSNIKFEANNTDFNLEYLKIYPTHIDVRVKLGENKLDKSECWSIGRKLGTDKGEFPYLIDELGNKYLISGNILANIDSNKCINLSFGSCYFNKNKELYLVISQLQYMPGPPFVAIDPIKVRIK